jgi:hypothetical protein
MMNSELSRHFQALTEAAATLLPSECDKESIVTSIILSYNFMAALPLELNIGLLAVKYPVDLCVCPCHELLIKVPEIYHKQYACNDSKDFYYFENDLNNTIHPKSPFL